MKLTRVEWNLGEMHTKLWEFLKIVVIVKMIVIHMERRIEYYSLGVDSFE